jgi:hypothetical protein
LQSKSGKIQMDQDEIRYRRPKVTQDTYALMETLKSRTGTTTIQLIYDMAVFYSNNINQALIEKFNLELDPEKIKQLARDKEKNQVDEDQEIERVPEVSKTIESQAESEKQELPKAEIKEKEEPKIKQAKEVYDYYCQVFGRSEAYKFRPQKIIIRLKENTVDELKACIDACKASAFHNGEYDQGKIYNSLYDHILAPSKIDKWLSESENSKAANEQIQEKKNKQEFGWRVQAKKEEAIRKYHLSRNPYGEIIDTSGEKVKFGESGDLSLEEARRLEILASEYEKKNISNDKYKFKRNVTSSSQASTVPYYKQITSTVPYYKQINRELDVPDPEIYKKNKKFNFEKSKLNFNPIGVIVDGDNDPVEFLHDGNLHPEQELKLQKLLEKQSMKEDQEKSKSSGETIIQEIKKANSQDPFYEMVSSLTGKMAA